MGLTPEQWALAEADREYDRLREDGFYSPLSKVIIEEMEERERRIAAGEK